MAALAALTVGCSLPPLLAGSSTWRSLRSARQIRQVAEMLERLRIGERVHILDRQSMNDIAYRELGEFPRQRTGEVGNGDDFSGHVPGCRVCPDGVADLLAQGLIESNTRLEAHEHYDAHITLPIVPDCQGFHDLCQ